MFCKICLLNCRYLNYELMGIGLFKLSQYDEAINQLKKGVLAKAVFKL